MVLRHSFYKEKKKDSVLPTPCLNDHYLLSLVHLRQTSDTLVNKPYWFSEDGIISLVTILSCRFKSKRKIKIISSLDVEIHLLQSPFLL